MFSRKDIDYIIKTVEKAGSLASSMQRKGVPVFRKEDRSIVTTADVAVQELIERKIRKRFPCIKFVHEENFNPATTVLANDELYAVIDPIDGTAVYTMSLPTWCISVGIFSGALPLYGFVFSPCSHLFYHNDDDSSYRNGREIMVDPEMETEQETNIFLPPYLIKNCLVDFPGKVRNLGSTALHGCMVADSRATRTMAFFGRSYLWDWAGSIPVILKAGGSIRYVSGKEIDFNEVAHNGFLFPEYLLAYAAGDFQTVRSFLMFTEKKTLKPGVFPPD